VLVHVYSNFLRYFCAASVSFTVFIINMAYLRDTGTDTGQNGQSLLVNIVAENLLEEDGVLLVGRKLCGTLGCLNHDGRDDATVESTESNNIQKSYQSLDFFALN